jgi:hypothetical protein
MNSLVNEEMRVACKTGGGTVRDIIHLRITEIDFNKWTNVRQIISLKKSLIIK